MSNSLQQDVYSTVSAYFHGIQPYEWRSNANAISSLINSSVPLNAVFWKQFKDIFYESLEMPQFSSTFSAHNTGFTQYNQVFEISNMVFFHFWASLICPVSTLQMFTYPRSTINSGGVTVSIPTDHKIPENIKSAYETIKSRLSRLAFANGYHFVEPNSEVLTQKHRVGLFSKVAVAEYLFYYGDMDDYGQIVTPPKIS